MKTFANFPALTSSLAFDLIDMIMAADFGACEAYAQFGMSNVSCSAYVEFSLENEEGDTVAERKVRFSDHADRHGSDMTIRIDDKITTIEDDGEYAETQISEEDYAGALAEAFSRIQEVAA